MSRSLCCSFQWRSDGEFQRYPKVCTLSKGRLAISEPNILFQELNFLILQRCTRASEPIKTTTTPKMSLPLPPPLLPPTSSNKVFTECQKWQRDKLISLWPTAHLEIYTSFAIGCISRPLCFKEINKEQTSLSASNLFEISLWTNFNRNKSFPFGTCLEDDVIAARFIQTPFNKVLKRVISGFRVAKYDWNVLFMLTGLRQCCRKRGETAADVSKVL